MTMLYKEIIRVVESVLKKTCSRIVIYSPFFNVLKNTSHHKNFLDQFFDSNHKRNNSFQGSDIDLKRRFLKNLSRIKFFNGTKFPLRNKKFDLVIVTHYFGDNSKIEEDLYFSDLIKELKRNNKKILSLKINHSNKELTENHTEDTVILPSNISFFKELVLFLLSIKDTLTLVFKFRKDDFLKRLFFKFLKSGNFLYSLSSYRLEKILTSYFKDIDCNSLVTTLEGHGREKAIFFAARKANFSFIAGYQHSIICESSHSIFNSYLCQRYNPTHIFSSIQEAKKIFKSHIDRNIKVVNIGSPNFRTIVNKSKRNKIILIPEAIHQEYSIFLELAKKLSEFFGSDKVIFRPHPALKIDEESKKEFNFEISLEKIEKDISRSFIAIYRGSAAILPFVYNSAIPIRFQHSEFKNSCDPLFIFGKKTESCTLQNFSAISSALNEDKKITNDYIKSLLEFNPSKFIREIE